MMIGIVALLYFLVGSISAILICHQYELDDGHLAMIVGIALIWPVIAFLFGVLWLFTTLIDYVRRQL